jgi:hypothetical protein
VVFGLIGLALGFGSSFLYGKAHKKSSLPRVVGAHIKQGV